MCILLVRLATSIPLAPQLGTQMPPLPFPADEDVSSCHLTPTIKSPTQPWHGASLDPTDDHDTDSSGTRLTIQTLPPPLFSHTAPIAVTRKRNENNQTTEASNTTTTAVICTTIAAFTFTDLPIYPPLGNRQTVPSLTLDPGRYVLSFTNNYRVVVIGVKTVLGGHGIISMYDIDDVVFGTVAFALGRTTEVSFIFCWGVMQAQHGGVWLASGEVALFRIGPG